MGMAVHALAPTHRHVFDYVLVLFVVGVRVLEKQLPPMHPLGGLPTADSWTCVCL